MSAIVGTFTVVLPAVLVLLLWPAAIWPFLAGIAVGLAAGAVSARASSGDSGA